MKLLWQDDPLYLKNQLNSFFSSGTYTPVITGMTVSTGTLATVNVIGYWQRVGTFCMVSFDIYSSIGQNIQLGANWTASLPLSIKRTSSIKTNQTEGRQLSPFTEAFGSIGRATQSTTQDYILFPTGLAGRSIYTVSGLYLVQ
jgi:hypothetical protein